jgi:hypothetical protein
MHPHTLTHEWYGKRILFRETSGNAAWTKAKDKIEKNPTNVNSESPDQRSNHVLRNAGGLDVIFLL